MEKEEITYMKVYQVLSIFKHDLNYHIQLVATYKSLENAQNYIRLAVKCLGKEIEGPCNPNILCDSVEYVASCRIDGSPCCFEDYYIRACPIVDELRIKRG